MLLTLLLLLFAPQTPVTAPFPATPASPAECLAAARTYSTTKQREAAPLTAASFAKIDADKRALTKTCAAAFNVDTLPPADLVTMVQVYGETGEADKAAALIASLVSRHDLSPVDRAGVLQQAILVGLREPKGDARNARLEGLVAQLDALPPSAPSIFEAQWAAHQSMNGYYRSDDIDAGIIKHSTWLIDASKNFTRAQLEKYGSTIASAHVYMAEAYAGQGMTPKAIDLLKAGIARVGSLPFRNETLKSAYFDEELSRLQLVGLPAAAITAPQWFNHPAASPANTLTLPGQVTLLEFTAHWCGPCRESYPGLNRLRAKYAPQGFRVAMVTQLYGYFGAERNVAPADEIAKDKAYFAEHELADVPVAIGNKVDIKVVNGKVEYLPAKDPNDVAYHVTGIPQIQIIDKRGRVRLIMVGYDDANEPKLAAFIEQLLAEK